MSVTLYGVEAGSVPCELCDHTIWGGTWFVVGVVAVTFVTLKRKVFMVVRPQAQFLLRGALSVSKVIIYL